MRLIIALVFLLSFTRVQADDQTKGIIDLAEFYHKYMFGASAPKDLKKNLLSEYHGTPLQYMAAFIAECTTENNDITENRFMSLPSKEELVNAYCIFEIYLSMHENRSIDKKRTVDSLRTAAIPYEWLLDNYYNMCFNAYGNKNKPFNMSKVDFNFKDLKLESPTEQGIFFLQCMDGCGVQIWGYMNIPKPPNTKKAMEVIQEFPKINGEDYYLHKDLSFQDFDIVRNDSLQSFKSFYIDKYYELLFNHFVCLDEQGGTEEEKRAILLNSLLPIERYWQYTRYKDALERIFEKQE